MALLDGGFWGWSLTFAYGLFTLIRFGIAAVLKGTFFRRPTEREKLEFLLGTFEVEILVEHTVQYDN